MTPVTEINCLFLLKEQKLMSLYSIVCNVFSVCEGNKTFILLVIYHLLINLIIQFIPY